MNLVFVVPPFVALSFSFQHVAVEKMFVLKTPVDVVVKIPVVLYLIVVES